MSIRAVARHHGVGWHRIMGLVRAHSAVVAQRRRAPPCRVLLVDETSIRRRHRYVTVVAYGDSGKVLAMIPGRTKASLARFFRDQGAWWCRQVEIVVPDGSRPYHPDHRTIPSRRSPCARPVPRRTLVHPRTHPGTTRDTTPRPRPASPNVRAGPACEPASPSYGGPIISPKRTRRTSIGCSTLIHVSEPRETLSKSSTNSTKPTTRTVPTQLLDASLISTPPARHREYREVVDTIIAWGEQIFAYHTTRRVSNGPLEGINNLHQVLRRVAHGFTNPNNYAARGILVT